MSGPSPGDAMLLDAIERLRSHVERLEERLVKLENSLGARVEPPCEISEEEQVLVSVAVAAYLGVKPKIRQIRLVGGAAWAQQGRATVQASRATVVQRG